MLAADARLLVCLAGLALATTALVAPAIAHHAGDPPAGNTPAQAAASSKAGSKAPPPIFSDLTLADALAKNTGDNLLIVKFTAEWCGPCKQMDRTTWRDQRVFDWVRQHGTAIQVDVDKRPTDAKDNNISAMPTTIVFKDGKPIQRRVGFINADQMLAFLARAKDPNQGQHEAQAKAPQPGEDGNKFDIRRRLNAARDLADNGQLDKATDEFVWLWNNMLEHQPSMYGVRRSFMIGDMQRLAFRHKPALDAFAALRDAAETRLKGPDKSFEDLLDWIALNQAVAQEDKTLAWFDRVKADPDVGPTFHRVGFALDTLLVDNNRWADLALLWPDPIAQLKREQDMWLNMPKLGADADRNAEMDRLHRDRFRTATAQVYVSQLAAGKLDSAQKVADEALRIDDSPLMRVALVKLALKARVARPEHAALLDAAIHPDNKDGLPAEIDRLRTELQKVLAKDAG